jgi:hypothetical protein
MLQYLGLFGIVLSILMLVVVFKKARSGSRLGYSIVALNLLLASLYALISPLLDYSASNLLLQILVVLALLLCLVPSFVWVVRLLTHTNRA